MSFSTATKSGKLVLWSSAVTRNNYGSMRANSYYRVYVPFQTAKDMDLAQDFYIEGHSPIGPNTSDGERALMALLADVVLLSNMYGERLQKNVTEINKLVPAIDPDTLERVYPPVTVFDQDDLTEYCSIFNDTYRNLGTRGPNGEPLEEGAEIYMSDPAGGDPILLWRDGECPNCLKGGCSPGAHQPWDLKRNKENLEKIYALARSCHGATFTNEHLSKFYRDEVGLKNVYTFPNSVYLNDYHKVELAEHPSEVRILWQGGSSHFEDWAPVAGALGRVMKKYPNAKMIMWGQPFPFVERQIRPEQLEYLTWVPHAAYLARLNTLSHDINLAPLAKNKFNESKSAIKWYESSAISRPAATLASNAIPYSDEIIDGETGLLFDNEAEFETKLSGLIEDTILRKRLAQNAQDWVVTHRDSRKTVPPLLDWYMSLRAEYDKNAPWAPEG